MSLSSIGSLLQSAASSWGQTATWDSSVAASDSLISAIGTAETNLGKGLASIANGQALNRVNSQLTSEIQNILNGGTGTSSTASSTSTATKAKAAVPATATGTVPVTVSTTLKTLRIPAGGAITITAGSNTTTYASTGSDTVGTLLNAANVDLPTNAQVTASLNSKGDLVFTSRNTSDTITIGGVYASNIGFPAGKQTFKPTPGTAATPSTTTTSPAKSSTTSPSTSTAHGTSYSTLNAVSAASLLADSGVAGSLVNMVA
jgi:hypothetical protein